jgi:hypothetical protein
LEEQTTITAGSDTYIKGTDSLLLEETAAAEVHPEVQKA